MAIITTDLRIIIQTAITIIQAITEVIGDPKNRQQRAVCFCYVLCKKSFVLKKRFTKGKRRHSGFFFDEKAEIVHVVEAALLGNIFNGAVVCL